MGERERVGKEPNPTIQYYGWTGEVMVGNAAGRARSAIQVGCRIVP